MPHEEVFPAFRFGLIPLDLPIPQMHPKRRQPKKDPLQAYKSLISPSRLEELRDEYNNRLAELMHMSFTEFVVFVTENKQFIMEDELYNINTRFFGFPVIQHSDNLVEFYTGLPNSSQFYYVSSMLQRWIFTSYIKWEANEKHGFLNHTLITLMKLRLNMPDEEIAERFGIEPYMVNMTLRVWLPGLYICIYKNCEELYKIPSNNDVYTYNKVVDVVEICFETDQYTRRWRDNKNEIRKAVLSVRSDGFVTYASHVYGGRCPDSELIKRSRFADTCYYMDLVAIRSELLPTLEAKGISCRRMPNHAEYNIREATNRIKEFRILMGIPEEYKTYHEYIFPVCAALSNFYLVEDDDADDPELVDQEVF